MAVRRRNVCSPSAFSGIFNVAFTLLLGAYVATAIREQLNRPPEKGLAAPIAKASPAKTEELWSRERVEGLLTQVLGTDRMERFKKTSYYEMTIVATKNLLNVSLSGCSDKLGSFLRNVVRWVAHVVIALQSIVSRQVPPRLAAVLTVSMIHGGTKENVIPDEVTLRGTCRTLDPELREQMPRRIQAVAEPVRLFGGSALVVHPQH